MTKVVNRRGYVLEIAATGERVEPGAEVEVDDDLAASLLEQDENWGQPDGAKPRARRTDTPAEAGDEAAQPSEEG